MFTIANAVVLKGLDLIPVKENIVVDDGKVIDIDENAFEGKIYDCSNCIVSPTFINSHTHIGDSIIPDEGYGLSLDEMVKPPNGVKHVALSNASDTEIIESMKIAMWEMVKSGVSHFIDYREGGIKGVRLLKKASKDIPIKPIILGRDDSFYGDNPDLRDVKIAVNKLLDICDGIAPSGFGEISNDVAELIVEECRNRNKISSIHTAESKEAQLNSLKKFNQTEIKRAITAGFDQIVHSTNPMKNDLELIAESNTNLVLCPRANSTLSVGVAPIPEILEKSIKPVIGSDNYMLNSPNILRELEFTIKLIPAIYNKSIDPVNLLKMATTNICRSPINNVICKSRIDIGEVAEFIVSKQKSKNPYLSIINRLDRKSIISIIKYNNLYC